MNQIKKPAIIIFALFSLLTVLSFFPFSEGLSTYRAVRAEAAARIRLSERNISIEAGQTFKLRLLNTDEEITWETSDKKIAKVSSKGRITAKKAGKCKIYAYAGTQKYTCRVTVYNNYTAITDYYSVSGFSTLMGKLPLKKYKYDNAPAYFKDLSTLGKRCIVYFGLDADGRDISLDSDNYVFFIKNIFSRAKLAPDNPFLAALADAADAAYSSGETLKDANGREYYAIIQHESDFDSISAGTNDGDKSDEGFFFIFYPNKRKTDLDCIFIGCNEDSFEHISWIRLK